MRIHRHAAARLFSPALLAAALFGGDCTTTDDSSSSGSAGAAADAPTKCTTLVNKLCVFSNGCGIQDLESCVGGASLSLDCSRAVSVTSSYDQCLLDVDALTCPEDKVLAVPSTCSLVIVVGPQSTVPGDGWQSVVVSSGAVSAE